MCGDSISDPRTDRSGSIDEAVEGTTTAGSQDKTLIPQLLKFTISRTSVSLRKGKGVRNRLLGSWSSLWSGGDFKAQLTGRGGSPRVVPKRRASIDTASDSREFWDSDGCFKPDALWDYFASFPTGRTPAPRILPSPRSLRAASASFERRSTTSG